MPGRPTKLTTDVHQAIVTSVRNGNYASVAARAAGVHEDTYFRWIREASDDLPDNDPRIAFAADIARAEADAENDAVQALGAQKHVDWRAAEAYLKRRFPSRWSEKVVQEQTGPGGGPIKTETEVKGVALDAILDFARRSGAAPGGDD